MSIAQVLRAEDRLAENLAAHVGEWVAVRDHDVIGSANTLKELLDRIDLDGVDRILEVTKDSAAAFLL
jgi:hypothetical protein